MKNLKKNKLLFFFNSSEKIKEIENLRKEITNCNFTLNELQSNKNMLMNQLEKLKSTNLEYSNQFNKEKQSLNDKENLMNL